jgi:CheY-like chemotaxis protein
MDGEGSSAVCLRQTPTSKNDAFPRYSSMVTSFNWRLNVLLVDDDPDYALFVKFGFQKLNLGNGLHIVESGEAAEQYLSGSGRFSDRRLFPLPNLILTDLKMPGIDGFDLLAWLRVRKAYALGANSCPLKVPCKGEIHLFRTQFARGRKDCGWWRPGDRSPAPVLRDYSWSAMAANCPRPDSSCIRPSGFVPLRK